MTTSKEVLSLYKQLLGKAAKFTDYNYRTYARRRIVDAFKANKDLSDESIIKAKYNFGIDNLGMLQRQTTISQMFTFDKLVVERLEKHHWTW